MRDFLNRPYQRTGQHQLWKHALTIGFFVFLFLSVFQPFGLSTVSKSYLLKVTLGYGAISFLITLAIGLLPALLSPASFSEDNWNIRKEIINITTMVIGIAVGNYLYTAWLGFIPFGIKGFVTMLFFTLPIAIIIVIGLILFQNNRSLKRHLEEARKMNSNIAANPASTNSQLATPVLLKSEVEKQSLSVHPERLIYLSSEGNYIVVNYLNDSNEVHTAKIRNRIKTIEAALSSLPQFFRCHRAFIINKKFIKSVEGTAKGYTLFLNEVDTQIPVSRSKSQELKAFLS